MQLKDLQAKFAQMLRDHETLAAKSDLSAEDHQRLDTSLGELKTLRGQIERAQQHQDLAKWASESAGSVPVAPAEIKAGNTVFTEAGDEEGNLTPAQIKTIRSPEYKAAFREYLRGKGNFSTMKSESIKVLQEGNDSSGGFLVPEDILNRVIAKEPAPTTVQGRVTMLNTNSDALVIPKLRYDTNPSDDPNSWLFTTGMRVTWVNDEIPASSTAIRVTDPVWANVRIPVHTAMFSLPVTNNMIEDASFPLVSYLSGKFSETYDLTKENVIINGTGIGQPYGLLNNPGGTGQPAIVLSGSAGSLGANADNIIKMISQLPPQYDNNAVAVFNKNSTMQALAQMKDSNNRYIWGSGLQDSGFAAPLRDRRLLGYECIINNFMPNVGAANFPIVFGDLSGYYLVQRLGLSIQVLRELYAETNQVLILARARFGGQVIEDWKLQAYKSNNT